MAKYKIFDLIYRQGKNKKLKTQFELCSVNENIDKITNDTISMVFKSLLTDSNRPKPKGNNLNIFIF